MRNYLTIMLKKIILDYNNVDPEERKKMNFHLYLQTKKYLNQYEIFLRK